MSKRRSHKPSPQPSNRAPHVTMTQEQLAEAISLGIEQAEARRQAKEEKKREEAYERWCIQIKRPKNYDRLKGWKAFCADLRTFGEIICISFRRRNVEEGPLLLHNLIALFLSVFFHLVRCFFVFVAIGCVLYWPVICVLKKESPLNLVNAFLWAVFGALLLAFSSIFKFIADEILEIEDIALLVSLMSLFLSLASIIISIAM